MSADILADRDEAVRLFEVYGPLLTEREKALFSYYYSYDLSLSEIAENESISRAAVSDSLGKSLSKMKEDESRLGLLSRQREATKLLKEAREGSPKERESALAKLEEILNHGI
ncbi:MAG: DNA-binding protein [Bacilli bacterium]|jgi:predicted DNA-binding protein YlxM (UPF0122 family)|nr:DNA-binding protein [Bacilli bacterium]